MSPYGTFKEINYTPSTLWRHKTEQNVKSSSNANPLNLRDMLQTRTFWGMENYPITPPAQGGVKGSV